MFSSSSSSVQRDCTFLNLNFEPTTKAKWKEVLKALKREMSRVQDDISRTELHQWMLRQVDVVPGLDRTVVPDNPESSDLHKTILPQKIERFSLLVSDLIVVQRLLQQRIEHAEERIASF